MAGEGAAIAKIALAFPGTVVLKWATNYGWTQLDHIEVCVTCGSSTVQVNPDGQPDHFRHYQNDGNPVVT